MKESKINFNVTLDDQHVPEKISWEATDKPSDGPESTNAIAISLWDQKQKNTMRMDLWTKDMTVDEMKMFYVDSIGGMAQSLEDATGDSSMAQYIRDLCSKLVTHIETTREK